MPVISVIVPIFGVEKYIERCALSLFSQSMPDEDIEFIFVNDCTNDSSITILEHLISKYQNKNITILHHTSNKGLPAARRTGLKVAKGDYIIHCDSDDWVEPDYCKKLYEYASINNADIAVCGYRLDDGKNQYPSNEFCDRILTDKRNALSAAISLKSSPYLWNKIVKRTLYDKPITFPQNFLAEDWVLSVQLCYYANRIVVIDDSLYNYYMSPNSALRCNNKDICLKRISDEKANVQIIESWLQNIGIANHFRKELIIRKAVTKEQVFPVVQDIECRKVWRDTFREANWPILFHNLIPFHYKKKHICLMLGIYPVVHYLFALFRKK